MLADTEKAFRYRLNGFADISLSAGNGAARIESLLLVYMDRGGTRKESVTHKLKNMGLKRICGPSVDRKGDHRHA
jgi:hypothetical protein